MKSVSCVVPMSSVNLETEGSNWLKETFAKADGTPLDRLLTTQMVTSHATSIVAPDGMFAMVRSRLLGW